MRLRIAETTALRLRIVEKRKTLADCEQVKMFYGHKTIRKPLSLPPEDGGRKVATLLPVLPVRGIGCCSKCD